MGKLWRCRDHEGGGGLVEVGGRDGERRRRKQRKQALL
jgi:hypothetical protein